MSTKRDFEKEVSRQSRKIGELIRENKKLRLLLRDMGNDLVKMTKETKWFYRLLWDGHPPESIQNVVEKHFDNGDRNE